MLAVSSLPYGSSLHATTLLRPFLHSLIGPYFSLVELNDQFSSLVLPNLLVCYIFRFLLWVVFFFM